MSNSTSVTYTPDLLDKLADEVNAAKTYLVTLFGILVWDTLATFPQEWEYVWKARWSPIKVAFLINRYWTILTTSIQIWLVINGVSESLCQRIARIQPAGVTVTVMTCAVILTIRVWALYQKSMRILLVLGALMLVEGAVLSVATSQFQPIDLSLVPEGHFSGCVASTSSGHPDGFLVAFWGAPLAFDTVILGLTAYRVYQLRKVSGRLRILTTFLADAGFYYSVILVCDLVNLAFYAQPDPVLRAMNAPLSAIMTSIMASRIVLHLHSSMKSPQSQAPNPQNDPPQYAGRPRSPMIPKFSFVQRPDRVQSSRSFSQNSPLSGMVVPGEELPMAVRVALRGIGRDERELGLVDDAGGERTLKDYGRSSSVGEGIRIEREVVKVEEYEGKAQ